MMRLLKHGKGTSSASVENITPSGIWVFAGGAEYFLSYEDFPMFRNKTVGEILNVAQPHEGHLCWPDIDVDLELGSIKEPRNYPLVDRLAK